MAKKKRRPVQAYAPNPVQPAQEKASGSEIAENPASDTENVSEETEQLTAAESADISAAQSDGESAAESADAAAEQEPSPPVEEEYSIKTLISDVSAVLQRYDLPNMLMPRLIGMYFSLAGSWVLYMRHKVNVNPVEGWHDFIENVSAGRMLTFGAVYLIAIFVLLSSVYHILPPKARIADQSFAIASVLFFDIALLWRMNNFFLTVAVSLISLVFIYYLLGKLPSKELYLKIPWQVGGVISLIAAVCMMIFIARTTVAKHMIFGTACHDFGLFVQMYHSLSNGIHAITTCERDTPLSHFYIHSSYIYYLLVPFYKLIPKESTLLIAQAVLAMGGAVPTFLIAKRHNFKGLSLIFFTFAYTFSVAVIGPCFYDFHENAFLPTLLMWLFWAIDGNHRIMIWVMTFLVCIVKEDAPLYIVCIGLFLFFEHKGEKRRWRGLLLSVLSGVYMVIITSWLTKNGDGSTMTSIRFGNLMINQEKGLSEVVKNVLLDPSYFFSLLIHEDTLNFFLQIMLPLLFLPFMTKKIYRFMLMLPFVIMNMSVGAGYGYAANIGYHYIFGPFCLLLYVSMLNLDDMGEDKKQETAVLLGASAMMFFFGMLSHNIDKIASYRNSQEGFQAVEDALDSIPQDARVAASAFLLSHCADRDEIYLFDFNDTDRDNNRILEPDRYDFIVLNANSELSEFAEPLLQELGFTMFNQVENRIVIYQSPGYAG